MIFMQAGAVPYNKNPRKYSGDGSVGDCRKELGGCTEQPLS